MSSAPCSTRRAATVDLPLPMPPVSPTRNMALLALDSLALGLALGGLLGDVRRGLLLGLGLLGRRLRVGLVGCRLGLGLGCGLHLGGLLGSLTLHGLLGLRGDLLLEFRHRLVDLGRRCRLGLGG